MAVGMEPRGDKPASGIAPEMPVQLADPVKVITMRPTSFAAVAHDGSATIENIYADADANANANANAGRSSFVSRGLAKSRRPELTATKIIVSGGSGISSDEAISILDPPADMLGAAMGASPAAVDAGYLPADWQVGQTGKLVASRFYSAAGIFGSVQHLADMKDSKAIVAINKEPDTCAAHHTLH